MLAIETFGDRHQTVFTEYPIISRSGGNNDSGAVRNVRGIEGNITYDRSRSMGLFSIAATIALGRRSYPSTPS
jgi:hypothetical protein